MILFPAIDIKDGQCVRLLYGDMDQVTVFNDSPLNQAKEFQAKNLKWLHVVDLNGAIEGKAVNEKAVREILDGVDMKVQLGGGIRTMENIDFWLNCGVERVILGTVALHSPKLVEEACKKYPGRIVVSIDSKEGFVAVEGWVASSKIRSLDLALRLDNMGVAAIVYTDIDRDGALTGVNIDATVDLAWAIKTPVIGSGGVSGLGDLKALKEEEKAGIEGVISGRALYDGRLDIDKAIEILKG
ncbi:MAG: 1-(5-phosphoribosyl)-5-[(5-phosphoribosylamino)methylideneamino]imidazole-4-carboxamide isomerase [Alphaproteobacteria bacterium]